MAHGLDSWIKYRYLLPATSDIELGRAIMMGQFAGEPVIIAVDPDGNMIALAYGSDGVDLHNLAVDGDGQLIMVPRGESGNYMDVDPDGYLSSVMKGLDGATLRTVAVDGDGNIIGVLKGQYDSTLKTITVDDQGRLLAVLTDPEDTFGNANFMGAAELAARLGSVDTYERRGQVLFLDSFDQGVGKWVQNSAGTGADLKPYINNARTGSVCAEVTTGSAGFLNSAIVHYFSPSSLKAIGFEMSFTKSASHTYIDLQIQIYDGSYVHNAQVRYDVAAATLSYKDSDGAWQSFASSVFLYSSSALFHSAKLVIDPETSKYVRFLVGNLTYDLSAYSYQKTVSALQVHGIVTFYTWGAAASNIKSLVDDAIITQNEPA